MVHSRPPKKWWNCWDFVLWAGAAVRTQSWARARGLGLGPGPGPGPERATGASPKVRASVTPRTERERGPKRRGLGPGSRTRAADACLNTV